MRALLSVSDKTNLVELGKGLTARGYELVSTGGTARALADAGVSVTSVSQVTGFPEIMDGRVKTLHPAVHGGILARRDRRDDLDALESHGIRPIDVVAVNLYPFARAAARPETTFEALIEEIDIGGPSLARAAAKNFKDVIVVVDPADYAHVLQELDRPGGPTAAFRLTLALQSVRAHGNLRRNHRCGPLGRWDEGFPLRAQASDIRGYHPGSIEPVADEDSWLAVWREPPPAGRRVRGWHRFWVWAVRASSKEKSSRSTTSLTSTLPRVWYSSSTSPAAVVIKHSNPCGAAVGGTLAEAYVRARETDPLSAFGGVVGLNRSVDAETARAVTSTFIEAVVAPEVGEDARPILAAKKALRLVAADFSQQSGNACAVQDVRAILGALLVQQRDRVVEASVGWGTATGAVPDVELRVVTKRAPTDEEWRALRFAWRVCAHVKSNAVIFAGPDRTSAIGAGQMSRVDAVKVAAMKATSDLTGTVAASDAFFPFRDGLDAIANTGATAVVQPGGSVRDAEVIAAADEHGMAMVFTGRRHFRH